MSLYGRLHLTAYAENEMAEIKKIFVNGKDEVEFFIPALVCQ